MTTPPAGAGFETSELHGRPIRRFRVAVSVGAMALAWARQDNAAAGSAVVTDREVYPLGRLGDPWSGPPETTLACAVVLRPKLPPHLADAVWLVGGLALTEGVEAASGRRLGTWWPDRVVDANDGQTVGVVKAEVQLGPGSVRSAVLTMRVDLERLGMGIDERDNLIDASATALDRAARWLDQGTDGCNEAVAAYQRRCGLLGSRVKISLLPKGETRGVARGVDGTAQLEVVSATGMVERVTIDMLRRLEVVDGER